MQPVTWVTHEPCSINQYAEHLSTCTPCHLYHEKGCRKKGAFKGFFAKEIQEKLRESVFVPFVKLPCFFVDVFFGGSNKDGWKIPNIDATDSEINPNLHRRSLEKAVESPWTCEWLLAWIFHEFRFRFGMIPDPA